MKTYRYLPAMALFLGVAMTLTFAAPRQAQADSKAGKIIGGLVAGALLYELLDGDDGHRQRGQQRHRQPARGNHRNDRFVPDPYYRDPFSGEPYLYKDGYYYDVESFPYKTRDYDHRRRQPKNNNRYRAPNGRYRFDSDNVRRGPRGRTVAGFHDR